MTRVGAVLGNVLLGHAVPVGVPTRIDPRSGEPFLEWFGPDALRVPGPHAVPVYLRHRAEGGVRIGHVARVVSAGPWIDVALLLDTPEGDLVLEGLGNDGGRLPLSIAFTRIEAGSVRYERGADQLPEVCRTKAWLREVAIVDAAAYPGAYTWARTTMAGVARLGLSK